MRTNKTKLVWIILITTFSVEVVIFLIGTVLLKNPSFLKEFSGLALSKKPETFTELYFVDHLKLPKTIFLSHEYSFQFKIHNSEGKNTFYPYEVLVSNGCGCKMKLINRNGVFLKSNETKTITEKFSISKPFDEAMIQVKLINKNQEIHFVVEQK